MQKNISKELLKNSSYKSKSLEGLEINPKRIKNKTIKALRTFI